jgi:NTP pyrophosphatase (non-canonical NTP hydrolase)
MTDPIDHLQSRYFSFIEERNWEQYHTPQNLAIAISIEANKLLENFLWFNYPSANAVAEDNELMEKVEDELADVVIYSLAMTNQLNIDLPAAVEQKIEENEERFNEERVSQFADDLEMAVTSIESD